MTDEITRRLDCIWRGMIYRCYSSNLPQDTAIYYRDKGITVCCEWKNSRDSFKEWALNNGYELKLTIDRINSDGIYCPENCQWLTKTENSKKAVLERERLKNGNHKHYGQWMVVKEITNTVFWRSLYEVIEIGLYKSEAIKKAMELNGDKLWQHKYCYSPTRQHRVGDIVSQRDISCFLTHKN